MVDSSCASKTKVLGGGGGGSNVTDRSWPSLIRYKSINQEGGEERS